MIRLERVEDVIKFTFNDNPLYLNNGTIEVPVNSLSLLIDESNIATFKKGNNDAFLSCSLDELGMTKEQLITWYKDNMVDEGGGITPEEVEEIVESATTNLFGYAEYDSNSQRINFKHDSSGSVISSIDASDFIIDGMVSNVEIVTISDVKYLKITFNTDSGKEPILIPLADIFNPDLYYTKSEIDEALSEIDETLSGKVDSDVFDEKERVISIALNDLDENKLDVSAYTPTDLSNYYTKSETSGATQISTALDGLMITVTGELNNKLGYDDITTSITSSSTNIQVPSAKAVNDLLDTKQNTLVSGTNIKTINNESILGSGNIDIQGGGVNVVQTTGSSTTDVMSQSAVTSAIPTAYISSIQADMDAGYQRYFRFSTPSTFNYFLLFNAKINGRQILRSGWRSDVNEYSLVETSAITTSITSSSTNTQVPSAKAVNDKLGGLSLVKLTQAEYDALVTKDSNTLYVIIN